MLGELIIWNLIGAAAKAHNKRVQEEFRKKFPKSNWESTPKMKQIENKPFSFYLQDAIEKIK